MKLVSKHLSLILAGTALVFGGCLKKPNRPDPSSTLLGPQGGGANANLDTTPIAADLGSIDPNLIARAGEGFDANNQNRSALEAQTVYFDLDSATIKPSEREKLRAAKEYLDQNPTYRLLLEGHCDWRGTAEYNLSLGDRRANSTKRYLQSLGVSPDRMDTLSKGSLEAMKNADAATMEKDRRVNLVVVNPAGVAQTPAPL